MAVFEAEQPLRVAVFFSGGASGFSYLANHDPNFGETYEVVVGISSDPDAPGMDALRAAGIPVEAHDIEAFYDQRQASLTDLEVRADYDAETATILKSYDPDLVLLSGYMWILTEPITDPYHVINVHPADLAIEDDAGDRQYIGADPVYDAIVAGEAETRSTVHFVTPAVDAGSILVRSKPLSVHRDLVDDLETFGAEGGIREYANAHQEWMKWEGDGPAIAKAVELIAAGRVDYDDGTVRIDGSPGYYDLEP
jgi:folate-dependent phosphoribosylglycinamide formyltransferase PurN